VQRVCVCTSDVVETVTFQTETWLKSRDRDGDFIKNSETETETRDLKVETETRCFKICAFCRIKKNVVITSDFIFFKFLAFFRHVLVAYLQIQQPKDR